MRACERAKIATSIALEKPMLAEGVEMYGPVTLPVITPLMQKAHELFNVGALRQHRRLKGL